MFPKPPMPKMPKAPHPKAASPMGGPLPKPRAPRHTTPRPRFHRAKMSGMGKSAYAPPGAKQAFDDPMAAGGPEMAFGGGPDMAGGGASEPGANDGGAAGPPIE